MARGLPARLRAWRIDSARRIRANPTLDAVVKREFRRLQGLDSLLTPPRRRRRRRWGRAWEQWADLRAQAVREGRTVHGTAQVVWESPGVARLAVGELLGPGRGDVMIRTTVSSVSMGTERATLLGEQNMTGAWPRTPGYSLAGVVEEVGPGVDSIDVGDTVAARAPHASRVVAPLGKVFAIPAGVPVDDAAFLQLGIIVGHGIDRGAAAPGDRIAVLGRGPIGQLATQYARALGAHDVVSIAPSRRRVSPSLSRFATRIVATAVDGTDVLDDIAADVTYEASGAPEAIFDAIRATRDGGRVVLLGSPTGVTRGFDLAPLADRGITLVGAHVDTLPVEPTPDRLHHRAAGEQFLDLIARGALDVRSLVSVEVAADDVGVFYRQMADGDHSWSGALLRWDAHEERRPVRSRRWLALPPTEAIAGADLRHNPDGGGTAQRVNLAPRMARPPARPAARGRLGFAVVGCGKRGAEVAARVDLARHATLVRVMDVKDDHARETGNHLRVPWSTNLDEVLADERVDAVFVATPHHLHAEPAIRAARAGKHLVVDKPLSHDVASARELVEAARDAGVQLSTWFGFRYRPGTFRAKELVRAGALGEFLGANVNHYLHHPPGFWTRDGGWRGSRDTSGGGVLIMNGIHLVDTLLWLAEQPVVEVYASQFALEADAPVEDAMALVLEFANGARATLHFSSCLPGLAFQTLSECRIWGRDGHISLVDPLQYYTASAIDDRATGRWHSLHPLPRLAPPDVELLERFSVAVLRGEEPEITGDDGLRVQLVIEAAYESARTGAPVRVCDPATEA